MVESNYGLLARYIDGLRPLTDLQSSVTVGGLRNQDRRPTARSQRIHIAGILPLKLILAENTEDAYLIITSRFNSFKSSLVLSISSAAFPTMT